MIGGVKAANFCHRITLVSSESMIGVAGEGFVGD